MPKHQIEVNDLKVYAFHGCLDEEAKIGGHYSVDVCITTDFSQAIYTDLLDDTVCYVDISKIVYEEMEKRSKLIERVGQRIVNRIKKELKGVHTCRLKLTKIAPPIPGEIKNVAIIIEE